MNPSSPPKLERSSRFPLVVVLIMTAIPCVICWIFVIGKVYSALAILLYLLYLLLAILAWLFGRRKASEADMIRRIDKAMGKPSDDPRHMALGSVILVGLSFTVLSRPACAEGSSSSIAPPAT